MHLILTGATGLVGSAVLSHILSLPAGQITRLSVLSRKPVPMANGHSNVHVIQQNDFSKYDSSVLEQLKGADGCVWALGVSQNDVGKEDYVKITKDWPLEAAKVFAGLSDPFKFVYVSGEGATLNPGRFTPFFGGVKGETESALLSLQKTSHPSLRVFSLRPGAVDPTHHPDVLALYTQRQTGMIHKLGRAVLLPVVAKCWAAGTSPTKDLGRVLTELATGDGEALKGEGVEGEGRTVTNKGFRTMAGL